MDTEMGSEMEQLISNGFYRLEKQKWDS